MNTSKISVVPQRVDLVVYAGDGVSLRLDVINADTGANLDLSGEIDAQVKAKRSDTDALTEFAVNTDEAADGVLYLALSGEQTAVLTDGPQFKGAWDVQWMAVGQEPRTLVQGSLTCDLDVTRS